MLAWGKTPKGLLSQQITESTPNHCHLARLGRLWLIMSPRGESRGYSSPAGLMLGAPGRQESEWQWAVADRGQGSVAVWVRREALQATPREQPYPFHE